MTLPQHQPISEAEFTRKHILTLWACKRFDTRQIAQIVKLTEAEVYNILSAHRAAQRGV